jgi:hypothetical protein
MAVVALRWVFLRNVILCKGENPAAAIRELKINIGL